MTANFDHRNKMAPSIALVSLAAMVVTTPPPPPPTSSSSSLISPASSRTTLSKYSASIPFLRRPPHLTGKYAGDVGFDPFNFASTPERLVYHRAAEIKHARLAMLAAAGWPLSELYDTRITDWMNDALVGWELSPGLLNDGSDRVPSALNGGLDGVSPYFWGFCLGIAAAIDVRGINDSRSRDGVDDDAYQPGDYGFDPLGLYPSDEDGRRRMELAEIKHGRLGMIAITGYALQEYATGSGVIDETPAFFRPFFHL